MVETSLVETSPRVDTAGMGQARRPQDSHFKDQKCVWAYHDCELQFPSFCRPARGPGLGCFDNPLFLELGKGEATWKGQFSLHCRRQVSNWRPGCGSRRHCNATLCRRQSCDAFTRPRGCRIEAVGSPEFEDGEELSPLRPCPSACPHSIPLCPLDRQLLDSIHKVIGTSGVGTNSSLPFTVTKGCELIPQRESAHVTRRRARKQK